MNDTTLEEHIGWLQEKGVGIINASPISMGLLSSRPPPQWHPALPHIKEACRQAADYCTAQGVSDHMTQTCSLVILNHHISSIFIIAPPSFLSSFNRWS
jgi:hypothetical protein